MTIVVSYIYGSLHLQIMLCYPLAHESFRVPDQTLRTNVTIVESIPGLPAFSNAAITG